MCKVTLRQFTEVLVAVEEELKAAGTREAEGGRETTEALCEVLEQAGEDTCPCRPCVLRRTVRDRLGLSGAEHRKLVNRAWRAWVRALPPGTELPPDLPPGMLSWPAEVDEEDARLAEEEAWLDALEGNGPLPGSRG
jgi:hypothetical protein